MRSQEELEFLVRRYIYNYRTFDPYNRKVASFVVLGDDRLGWRPDRFGYSLWGCTVDFPFPVVKLLDYAGRVEELERDRNRIATPPEPSKLSFFMIPTRRRAGGYRFGD